MAADWEREMEATEWAEALIADVDLAGAEQAAEKRDFLGLCNSRPMASPTRDG